jgi:hypothetical protein
VYRFTYLFVGVALVLVAIAALPIFIVSAAGVGLVMLAALFL